MSKESYQPSEEEIKKERTISDVELLKNGAVYEGDRLVVDEKQFEIIQTKHEKENKLPKLKEIQQKLNLKSKEIYDAIPLKIKELDQEFTSSEKIELREKIVGDFKIYPDKIGLASDNNRVMAFLRVEPGLYRIMNIVKEEKETEDEEDKFHLGIDIGLKTTKNLAQIGEDGFMAREYYGSGKFTKKNIGYRAGNEHEENDTILPLAGCPYANSDFEYRDAIKRILNDVLQEDISEKINILVEGDDEIAKDVQKKFDQKVKGTDLEKCNIKFHEFFDESVLDNFKKKFLEATGKLIFIGTGDFEGGAYKKPTPWDISYAYMERRNGERGDRGKYCFRYDEILKIEGIEEKIMRAEENINEEIQGTKKEINKIPY